MSSQQKSDIQVCYYCQRTFSTLFEFQKCEHKICTNCLFQTIFINNIQDFTGVNKINVKCKCKVGDLDQTLNDISSIIMNKTEMDEKNKDEDTQKEENRICPNHKSVFYLNYYCIECFTYICKECQSNSTNDHHCHRILSCKKLKKIIKNNINEKLFLGFNNDKFKALCDNIAKEIQTEVEVNFNKTLELIDSTIKKIIEFREEYIQKYKEEIKKVIQTFKILKIFYMNYYNDYNLVKEKGNLCNNINFLRYVNNISYEFVKLTLKHDDSLENICKDFNNLLKQYKQSEKKQIDYDFIFKETTRDYIIEDIISNVHSKYITGLVELNNDRILTSCKAEFLMKIFQDDEEGNGYKEKSQIKTQCGCLLYLEKTKRILSSDNDKNIAIYEELEPNSKPNVFTKTQTLSMHDKIVNCLAKLSDNQIISGGLDCRVIVWQEMNNFFMAIDSFKMDGPIFSVLGLFDSRIVFSCDDKRIFIYKIDDSFANVQKDIFHYIEDEVLIKHKGRVSCLCQLNNSYIVSGGTEKVEPDKKISDHFIIVWRTVNNKYICSQILNNHNSNITSIIKLRDGSFASSSYDRSVKIWRSKKEKTGDNIIYDKFELLYDLKQFDHGIHKLIQLKDDRLCATTSQNQIVFWRNRSGSY